MSKPKNYFLLIPESKNYFLVITGLILLVGGVSFLGHVVSKASGPSCDLEGATINESSCKYVEESARQYATAFIRSLQARQIDATDFSAEAVDAAQLEASNSVIPNAKRDLGDFYEFSSDSIGNKIYLNAVPKVGLVHGVTSFHVFDTLAESDSGLCQSEERGAPASC